MEMLNSAEHCQLGHSMTNGACKKLDVTKAGGVTTVEAVLETALPEVHVSSGKDQLDLPCVLGQKARFYEEIQCYNCGIFGHHLQDCEFPLNKERVKIHEHRQNLLRDSCRNGKIWQDTLSNFGDIRPGKPSPALRKALGIKANELPPYIYRMREAGYPPGWLRAARLTHGHIFVFTSVDEADEAKKEKIIDPTKIINYPGLNVLPPEGTVDTGRPPLHPFMLSQNWVLDKDIATPMQVVEKSEKLGQSTAGGSTRKESQHLICDGDGFGFLEPPKVLSVEFSTVYAPRRKTKAPIQQKQNEVGGGEEISTEPHDRDAAGDKNSKFPALPDWARHISKHITFENLPEATGNYDRLRKTIARLKNPQ